MGYTADRAVRPQRCHFDDGENFAPQQNQHPTPKSAHK